LTNSRELEFGISHDLHPKEREEIKLFMTEEAKQEYIADCGENAENYRFGPDFRPGRDGFKASGPGRV